MTWEEFPGCCGIAVIFDFNETRWNQRTRTIVDVDVEKRLKEVEADARHAGYCLALATTITSQKKARKALKARGWKELKRFKSTRTRNWIVVWWKKIK